MAVRVRPTTAPTYERRAVSSTTTGRTDRRIEEGIAASRLLVWNRRPIGFGGRESGAYLLAKRAVDLVVGLALLVVLSPLMVAIALGIALTSRGPVFFVQQRAGARRRRGRGGDEIVWEARSFACFKFRTMTQGADESVHISHIEAFVQGALESQDGDFKLRDDARVTRFGAFLRRTSLDELPQLINVVKGDMSLVGPRPVPLYEVNAYPRSAHLERLMARPGITGLWQVKGRSRVEFEGMVGMDIQYIRRQSILLDLALIVMTVPSVLLRRGAR
jgi:lipopolysaccharide/colanic/teichoic acid biosynthesis glycosyltransferase